MRRLTTRQVPIFVVPLLLCGWSAASQAQVDTSDWLCESCPFEDGYRADYEAGATYVSDDAARFGNATGYDKKGGYANLDGEGRYVNDDFRLDWFVEDLGLDSRVAELDAGRQGSYGFYLGYRELPYRLFDTSRTIFSPAASDRLALPAGWVPAGTTAGFTQLNSSLRSQNIESDRQIIDAGGSWLPSDRFRVFADYRRQNREGVDVVSGAGFTQSSLLPRNFDFSTDQLDLGVQYQSAKSSVTLAYYGSFFKNKNTALTWDTPFLTAPGAEQQRMAQEPDNEFQQLSLSGTYHFSGWHTVAALSLAHGRGEQTDTLLPYTINPNVAADPLPRPDSGGSVDTANYALTVTSKPSKNSRIKLAYRVDDRDNKTPRSNWTRVIVDLVNSGDTEQNVPYSFKRSRLNLSGEIRVWENVRLAAGYDRTDLDRDFQEVAEQSEDTGWGQLRWQPAYWFDLRARAGTAKRDIDRYDTALAQSFGQNPMMRKYNLAYRYRKFGEITASASMASAPVSISATVFATEDSFTKSRLGMTDANELRLTADISWAISERSSTYLMVGTEGIDSTQLGSEQFADADWQAAHDDSFDHVGIGFLWRQLTDKIDLQLDYTRGSGNTGIQVISESGAQSRLPDLESTLDSLRLEALYRWSDRWEGTLNLRYEKFSSDDWALQDVAPDTLPTILTLGAEPINYDVWALGLGFRYNFGNQQLALVN